MLLHSLLVTFTEYSLHAVDAFELQKSYVSSMTEQTWLMLYDQQCTCRLHVNATETWFRCRTNSISLLVTSCACKVATVTQRWIDIRSSSSSAMERTAASFWRPSRKRARRWPLRSKFAPHPVCYCYSVSIYLKYHSLHISSLLHQFVLLNGTQMQHQHLWHLAKILPISKCLRFDFPYMWQWHINLFYNF